MRSIVNKVLAKGQADSSRAPTLSLLLQGRVSRTLSREVEEWLVTHDVIALLEGLASHLLRTLPHDEIEETDKWLDGKKVSKVATTAVSRADVTLDPFVVEASSTHEVRYGVWHDQKAVCVEVLRAPKAKMLSAAARAHQHRLACITATAPQLATVVHENVLPTIGYWVTEESVALIHQRVDWLRPVGREVAHLKTRLPAMWLLRCARDVLSALSHLHGLGFLHRNLSVDCVFHLDSGVFVLGGFDYTVRSSRGRVTSPAWAPRVPAPETLQARTCETSTDLFSFGVFLLEVLNYGGPVALPLPTECPDHVPESLWTRVISPCLSHVRDARPSSSALLAVVDSLMSLGASSELDCWIPSQADRKLGVACALLSRAIRLCGRDDVFSADTMHFHDIHSTPSWTTVTDVLRTSASVRELRLERSWVSRELLDLPSLRHLRSLTLCDLMPAAPKDTPDPCAMSAVFREVVFSVIEATGGTLRCLRIEQQTRPVGDDEVWVDLWRRIATRSSTLVLETFALCGVGVSSALFREMEATWQGAPNSLRALSFGLGDVLSSNGVGFLCGALLRDTHVEALHLDGATLDYFSFGLICQLLRVKLSLRQLSLRGVNISACVSKLLDGALQYRSTAGHPIEIVRQ